MIDQPSPMIAFRDGEMVTVLHATALSPEGLFVADQLRLAHWRQLRRLGELVDEDVVERIDREVEAFVLGSTKEEA